MGVQKIIDENELLARLRAGDEVAFGEIYDLYGREFAYKLRKLVKITVVVEELHQDLFVRLWNSRANLSLETNLRAYLSTIARHLVIDFYRKAAKDKEVQSQLAYELHHSYDHIESLLSYKDSVKIVEELISMLPPQRQKVFRMIRLDGKSYKETSEYFGVSISTIKDHMARSSEFLKQQIADKFPHITFGIAVCYLFLK